MPPGELHLCNTGIIDDNNEHDDYLDNGGMFEEPADFRPPTPKPTLHILNRTQHPDNLNWPSGPQQLKVSLIGHHSLWSHCLWNAGVFLAKYFDENPSICKDKRVLELGAAAALPSFIAALNGAERVVITDYPDQPIIDNIIDNARSNLPSNFLGNRETQHNDRKYSNNNNDGKVVSALGYLWGKDVTPLIAETRPGCRFNLIIMSDLIFNHSEHIHLLETATQCLEESTTTTSPSSTSSTTSLHESDILSNQPQILVCFSHHRPWMKEKDMKFFELARVAPFHLEVEHVIDSKMEAMFPNDPGDKSIRETVHLYRMWRK